ncbi:MAG: KAP family NTPase [Chloroflexi bacterium]|nr:KAP family NTPase [Chloroflexota bacterium]
MLARNPNLEITDEKPFANDKLERRQLAENLTRLVQSTTQPFVISIEAPWGWGKTTFIEMWKKHLESQGNKCLYFNAWSNDFVDDPLTAFDAEMSSFVDKTAREAKGGGKIRENLAIFKKVGAGVLRKSLPLTIQLLTQGLISQETVKGAAKVASDIGDEVAKFAGELAEERIKQYEVEKKGIEEFKKSLKNLAELIAKEPGNKPPLVFFVDELDRCRPDYAIALLERIKHLFNVEGVNFILAVDREQVAHSIRSIYGQNMDADGYLRRFIDFSIHLPLPTTEKFCQFLFERFHMSEVFEGRRKKVEEQDHFIRTFTQLANSYKFSPRVIEQCFTEMNLILRTTPSNTQLFPEMLAFLVAFKAHKPETYSLLRGNLTPTNIKDVVGVIKRDINIKDRLYWWLLIEIEAYLLYGYLEGKEREEAIQSLKATAENSESQDREYTQRIIKILQEFEFDRYSGVIKFLISRLDGIKDLSDGKQ